MSLSSEILFLEMKLSLVDGKQTELMKCLAIFGQQYESLRIAADCIW